MKHDVPLEHILLYIDSISCIEIINSKEKRSFAKMGSRAVLYTFMVLVFVGWLFIWVMLPTPTYRNSWTPQLKIKLNSTYFREQGSNYIGFTHIVILTSSCLISRLIAYNLCLEFSWIRIVP